MDAGVALGQVVVVDAGGLELRGVKTDAYIALLVGNAAVIRRKRGDDVAAVQLIHAADIVFLSVVGQVALVGGGDVKGNRARDAARARGVRHVDGLAEGDAAGGRGQGLCRKRRGGERTREQSSGQNGGNLDGVHKYVLLSGWCMVMWVVSGRSALIRRCGGTFPRGGRLGAGCLPLRGKVAEAPPEAG